MALDTTIGGATSESYISVTDADTYFANRGITAWASMALPAKEQALRKATDYMLQVYRGRWQGYRVDDVQVLDWPRSDVTVDGYDVDHTTIPPEIARACAELAYKANSATLYPDEGKEKTKAKVGPISVEYDINSTNKTTYAAVDAMLKCFLKDGGRVNTPVVRV